MRVITFRSQTLTGLLVVVAALEVTGAIPASAAERCRDVMLPGRINSVTYARVCTDVASGNAGDERPEHKGRRGGPARDTCGLGTKGGLPGSHCVGTRICFIDETADPAQYGPPPAPPTPPAKYVVRMCMSRANAADPTLTKPIFDRFILVRPGEDPTAADPLDLFREAYGALKAPPAGIGFNPPGRAVVNTPTWFWTAGFPAEFPGDDADGLVAIATRDTTTWKFGDGATLSCPDGGTRYALGRTSTCTHAFRRSSAGQARDQHGVPAYRVTVTRRWNVRFEQDGQPVPVPGGTDEFAVLQATDSIQVPVAEIQSVGNGAD